MEKKPSFFKIITLFKNNMLTENKMFIVHTLLICSVYHSITTIFCLFLSYPAFYLKKQVVLILDSKMSNICC